MANKTLIITSLAIQDYQIMDALPAHMPSNEKARMT
jgi:hypothetical protein